MRDEGFFADMWNQIRLLDFFLINECGNEKYENKYGPPFPHENETGEEKCETKFALQISP